LHQVRRTIVAPSLVVISARVAGRPRTRATHRRELSIGTATWIVRTADARQAVPDQWLSLNWVERRDKELRFPTKLHESQKRCLSGALRVR
jgi:hypothetical protein